MSDNLSDTGAHEPPSAESFSPFVLKGRPLATAADVATLLDERLNRLLYVLYRAPEEARYVHFKIPKRSGGMRRISSPNGVVRRCQETLNPLLQGAYRAHPAAHGFIPARSILTNAAAHVGRRWVLNIDLADFFPSINFGRVRGLFMAPPFSLEGPAATVLAQICTYDNGLPQGAPTSPVLSNFIASGLDRKLLRLARENRLHYSRYADDITFSTDQPNFPPSIATITRSVKGEGDAPVSVIPGDALISAIEGSGFRINAGKVRVQAPYQRQSVTGITVNSKVNVERTRIRRLRAMLHAWETFGIEAAAREHFLKYKHSPHLANSNGAVRRFRAVVYGELAYVKMVRGTDDPVFLKLCGRLVSLDPNPSRFLRQMVFGANDFDVFISHATEDKADIARPIQAALEKRKVRVFLDEEHIAWGENFTKKINTALGAARTVVAVVSQSSISKDWPLAELNAALDLEITGQKNVFVVMVGKPDLSKLPLLRAKNYHSWDGGTDTVVEKVLVTLGRAEAKPEAKSGAKSWFGGTKGQAAATSVPVTRSGGVPSERQDTQSPKKRRWWWPFG